MVEFNQLEEKDVAAYDKVAHQHGAPTLWAAGPLSIKERKGAASQH